MYRFSKKSQIWCKNYFEQNQPFTKFVEATNNLTKLVEVGKHFTKFIKFANNFTKFIEFVNNFMKFIEFANNFTKFMRLTTNFYEIHRSYKQLKKFVGLTNNFWKVHKTHKNFMKFVDWKVGFKCLKVFLCLSFTHLNILIGKYKYFVNNFHVSWILFTNKLNSGCYIRVHKIFGTAKKWLLVMLNRWSFCSVNTTKYYSGGHVSGCYGEVAVL